MTCLYLSYKHWVVLGFKWCCVILHCYYVDTFHFYSSWHVLLSHNCHLLSKTDTCSPTPTPLLTHTPSFNPTPCPTRTRTSTYPVLLASLIANKQSRAFSTRYVCGRHTPHFPPIRHDPRGTARPWPARLVKLLLHWHSWFCLLFDVLLKLLAISSDVVM